MSKKKNILKEFSSKQLVWVAVALILFIGSIVLLVFGLLGEYGGSAGKTFETANEAISSAVGFGLNLTWIGVICLLLAAVIFAVALSLSSKNDDRESEKEERRKQRLGVIHNENDIDYTTTDSTLSK